MTPSLSVKIMKLFFPRRYQRFLERVSEQMLEYINWSNGIKQNKKLIIENALRSYLFQKSLGGEIERTCYAEGCNALLMFHSFLNTNMPFIHTFKDFHKLRKLWRSKYVEFYCCGCYNMADLYKQNEEL